MLAPYQVCLHLYRKNRESSLVRPYARNTEHITGVLKCPRRLNRSPSNRKHQYSTIFFVLRVAKYLKVWKINGRKCMLCKVRVCNRLPFSSTVRLLRTVVQNVMYSAMRKQCWHLALKLLRASCFTHCYLYFKLHTSQQQLGSLPCLRVLPVYLLKIRFPLNYFRRFNELNK